MLLCQAEYCLFHGSNVGDGNESICEQMVLLGRGHRGLAGEGAVFKDLDKFTMSLREKTDVSYLNSLKSESGSNGRHI